MKILLDPRIWFCILAIVLTYEITKAQKQIKNLEEKVEFLEKKTRNM